MLLDSSFLTQSLVVGLFTPFPFKCSSIVSTAEQHFLALIPSDYLKPSLSQEPLLPTPSKHSSVCQPQQQDSEKIEEMFLLPEPEMKIIMVLVPWQWNIIIRSNQVTALSKRDKENVLLTFYLGIAPKKTHLK